jgi:hypothetical protein
LTGGYYKLAHFLFQNQCIESKRLCKGNKKRAITDSNGYMRIEVEEEPRAIWRNDNLTWFEFCKAGWEVIHYLKQLLSKGGTNHWVLLRHWVDFFMNILNHKYWSMPGGQEVLVKYAAEARVQVATYLAMQKEDKDSEAVNISEIDDEILAKIRKRRLMEVTHLLKNATQARFYSFGR